MKTGLIVDLNQPARFSPKWLRWLGFLPLIFFVSRLVDVIGEGTPGFILWTCHFSNLTLALALLGNWPFMARFSFPWLLFGFPFWIWNISVFGLDDFSSFLTHVGGAVVTMIVLPQIGVTKQSWLFCGGWFLLLQLISRLFTDPTLNVNIAHAPYFGWESQFRPFWVYWVATTAGYFGGLWLFNQLLFRLWPATSKTT